MRCLQQARAVAASGGRRRGGGGERRQKGYWLGLQGSPLFHLEATQDVGGQDVVGQAQKQHERQEALGDRSGPRQRTGEGGEDTSSSLGGTLAPC